MPTYLYIAECKHGEFEEYHSITVLLDKCPECEKEGIVTPVKRLINSMTPGTVELTGHEKDAKFKEDVAQLKKKMGTSEKTYSSMTGEGVYQKMQQRIDASKSLFRRK